MSHHLGSQVARTQNESFAIYGLLTRPVCVTHVHICIGMYIYIHTYMYMCIYIRIHTTYKYETKYKHECVYIYIYMCVCMCMCTCIHACMHSYIYIYIHPAFEIPWGRSHEARFPSASQVDWINRSRQKLACSKSDWVFCKNDTRTIGALITRIGFWGP